jgi:hypothetical protein
MKTFLIVLVLIVAAVAGLGLYRGWFAFGSENASDKANVTLSVDKGKIEEDKDKAVEKVQDLGHQAKDKTATTTQKAKDQATTASSR